MTRWIRFVTTEDRAREREQTHVCEHQLPIALVQDWNVNAVLDELGGEPFVMVEWDIAFGPHEVWQMERAIDRAPLDVHAAPYHLYPQSTGLVTSVIAHRLRDDSPQRYRWLRHWYEAERCDAFSWGLTYWPTELVRLARTLELNHNGADTTLSDAWGKGAHLVWEARPVHLHWRWETNGQREVDAKA